MEEITKKFYVLGGKWFDKINGNTYHVAKIMDEEGKVYYTNYQYGYGNSYYYSAKEFIKSTLNIINYKLFDMGCAYYKKSDLKNGNF